MFVVSAGQLCGGRCDRASTAGYYVWGDEFIRKHISKYLESFTLKIERARYQCHMTWRYDGVWMTKVAITDGYGHLS